MFSDRSLPVAAVAWGAAVCEQIQTFCIWQNGRNSSVARWDLHAIDNSYQNTVTVFLSTKWGIKLTQLKQEILTCCSIMKAESWWGELLFGFGELKAKWTKTGPLIGKHLGWTSWAFARVCAVSHEHFSNAQYACRWDDKWQKNSSNSFHTHIREWYWQSFATAWCLHVRSHL